MHKNPVISFKYTLLTLHLKGVGFWKDDADQAIAL